MSAAAREEREEVEGLLWRYGLTAPQVSAVLGAVDRLAKAAVKASREPKAPAPKKPPAVHYAPAGGPACLSPHEWAGASGLATTRAAADATCGHCRKTPAWRDAEGAR